MRMMHTGTRSGRSNKQRQQAPAFPAGNVSGSSPSHWSSSSVQAEDGSKRATSPSDCQDRPGDEQLSIVPESSTALGRSTLLSEVLASSPSFSSLRGQSVEMDTCCVGPVTSSGTYENCRQVTGSSSVDITHRGYGHLFQHPVAGAFCPSPGVRRSIFFFPLVEWHRFCKFVNLGEPHTIRDERWRRRGGSRR